MKNLKHASADKIAAARMKLKRFIGTNKDAELNGQGHLVDNMYITEGYRIHHNTTMRACKSLYSCHNETVNVWTHLLGSVVYMIIFAFLIFSVGPHHNAVNSAFEDQFSLPTPCVSQEPALLLDDSKLSCFLAETISTFANDIQALTTGPADTPKIASKRVTELTARAKGIAFFAMDRQRDFSYFTAASTGDFT